MIHPKTRVRNRPAGFLLRGYNVRTRKKGRPATPDIINSPLFGGLGEPFKINSLVRHTKTRPRLTISGVFIKPADALEVLPGHRHRCAGMGDPITSGCYAAPLPSL